MSRRNFNVDFKIKVVLEVFKEVNILVEIVNKYKIYLQQIINWKKEFLLGVFLVFCKGKVFFSKLEAEFEKDWLMCKIGEQAIEIDFLKKRLF